MKYSEYEQFCFDFIRCWHSAQGVLVLLVLLHTAMPICHIKAGNWSQTRKGKVFPSALQQLWWLWSSWSRLVLHYPLFLSEFEVHYYIIVLKKKHTHTHTHASFSLKHSCMPWTKKNFTTTGDWCCCCYFCYYFLLFFWHFLPQVLPWLLQFIVRIYESTVMKHFLNICLTRSWDTKVSVERFLRDGKSRYCDLIPSRVFLVTGYCSTFSGHVAIYLCVVPRLWMCGDIPGTLKTQRFKYVFHA